MIMVTKPACRRAEGKIKTVRMLKVKCSAKLGLRARLIESACWPIYLCLAAFVCELDFSTMS